MSIQERLQLVLKMHNLTPSSFADQIGVQRSNISHVLSGRNKPSLDFLEKIVLNFPRVNAYWLITGMTPREDRSEEKVAILSDSIVSPDVSSIANHEGLDKIVFFYKDGTFETSCPRVKENVNA